MRNNSYCNSVHAEICVLSHMHSCLFVKYAKCKSQFYSLYLGGKVGRKTRFWIGFFIIVLLYVFPLAGMIVVRDIFIFAVVSAGFLSSLYLLYLFTIKKKEPKYPIVPPEGKPDIYMAAGMPRPMYEDMEQHPWFFEKKRKKPRFKTKKVKKKH